MEELDNGKLSNISGWNCDGAINTPGGLSKIPITGPDIVGVTRNGLSCQVT